MYTYKCIERESMIVLVDLSEGTTGGQRGNKNVRE
jgi:hypothetical protein